MIRHIEQKGATMMDLFTRANLRQLMLSAHQMCVSLYMPTHRTGREIREDGVRCKNLLSQAEEQLHAAGLRTPEARKIVQPAWELHDDSTFWQNQSDGLAMFAAPGLFQYYRVPLRFEERLVVGQRFHVKPILRLLQGDGEFFLLAVSQKHVRFLRGTHHSISELAPAALPRSLSDALNIDEYVQSLQQHSYTSVGIGGEGGATEGMFHGHGGSNLDVKKRDEIREYFLRIADGLQDFLHDDRSPLVFAGVDYLFPIFRDACKYRHLQDEPIMGNPDELKSAELHGAAWAIVHPYFERQQQAALQQYADLTNRDLTSHESATLVSAARSGRIGTLFVAEDAQLWGIVDEQRDACTPVAAPQSGAEDLLNYAAVHTLLHGGTVYVVDGRHMPGDQAIAGIFRYAATPAS
jgi:hypothetical protein